MGFNWKKALKIGGGLAGAYTGIPVNKIISERVKRKGYRDDPERGFEFMAAAMREAAKASLPDENVEQIDRLFLAWSILAAQERTEEEEPAPPPRKRKRRKKAAKKKAKR